MSFPDIAPGPAYANIHQMLELMAGIEASNAYGNFMFEHGRHFQADKLPKGIRKGPMKDCFRTSQQIVKTARNSDEAFIYVEGYAVSTATALPILHAWAVDKNGSVIDATWPDPEHCTYFGVAFGRDYLREATAKSKKIVSLIDNYEDRWSLLRGDIDLDFALYGRSDRSPTAAII